MDNPPTLPPDRPPDLTTTIATTPGESKVETPPPTPVLTNDIPSGEPVKEKHPQELVNQVEEKPPTPTQNTADKALEIPIKTHKDVDIQVGESYTDNKVNQINEHLPKNKIMSKSSKTLESIECLGILANTFATLLRNNSKELFQFATFAAYIYFGQEGFLVLAILNMLYHLFMSYSKNSKKDTEGDNNKNETVRPVYDSLKLPRTEKVKLKNKIDTHKNLRKKKLQRESNTSEESEGEEEITVTPPVFSRGTPKFSLTGYIHETPITFELDSGSAVSIIGSDTYDLIDPDYILKERPTTKVCSDFNNQAIRFRCLSTLQIKFQNNVVTHDFYISEGSKTNCLLGADIMRSKRIGIHHGDEDKVFVTFGNIDGQPTKRIPVDENFSYDLYVRNTEDLEGGEPTAVEVTLMENNYVNLVNFREWNNVTGIVRIDTPEFAKEDLLGQFNQDGLLTVPIHNQDFATKTLKEGQKIGTFKVLSPGTTITHPHNKVTETINEHFRPTMTVQDAVTVLEEAESKRTKERNNDTPIQEDNTGNQSPEGSTVETVNKITLSNDLQTIESDINEEGLVESLEPQVRIKESSDVWKDLLVDVPQHLQAKVFKTLTVDHPSVVSKTATDFGSCKLTESEFPILLKDSEGFTSRPYPLNEVYSQQVDEIIQGMVTSDLLVPESSNYSSSVFIRPRPDSTGSGNFRVRCITDYRKTSKVRY